MDAVHSHALRLVDRRGIAMVDPVVILEVEARVSAIAGLHGHGLSADLLNGSERGVLHAKTALVLQEHDAIPGCEGSRAALDRHAHLVAQIARSPHPLARCLIEHANFVIGVSENDPAPIR